MMQIVDIMLKQVQKRMEEQNIKIEIDESVKDLISKKRIDTNYGERPLRRAIQRYIEDELSDLILKSELQNPLVYKKEDIKIQPRCRTCKRRDSCNGCKWCGRCVN